MNKIMEKKILYYLYTFTTKEEATRLMTETNFLSYCGNLSDDKYIFQNTEYIMVIENGKELFKEELQEWKD